MARGEVCLCISTVTPFLVVFITATCWVGFVGVPLGHVPPATVTHVRVCKPFVIVLGVVVCYAPLLRLLLFLVAHVHMLIGFC